MSPEDFGLSIKGITQTIGNERKEFMLLGKLGVRLWGNILADKGVNGASKGINWGDLYCLIL